MIKVFYNSNILLFSSEIFSEKSFANIQFSAKTDIKSKLNIFFNIDNTQNLNIYNITDDEAMNLISNNFIFIRAAGGKIVDNDNRILFINRRGLWDLPKGKLEKNETIEDCAVREVCEECGLLPSDLENKGLLTKTYHIYPYNGSFALKETSWYLMKYTGDFSVTPQIEEEITEVKWIGKNELSSVLNNTFETIKMVVEA